MKSVAEATTAMENLGVAIGSINKVVFGSQLHRMLEETWPNPYMIEEEP